MKRGSLFFIGLISAIATIISLNIAFGRPGYYSHYPYHHRYHHCDEQYYRDHDERLKRDYRDKSDSTSNY